jgi:hypothetical protein
MRLSTLRVVLILTALLGTFLIYLLFAVNSATFNIYRPTGMVAKYQGKPIVSYGWSKLSAYAYFDGRSMTKTEVSGLCFITVMTKDGPLTFHGVKLTRSKRQNESGINFDLR